MHTHSKTEKRQIRIRQFLEDVDNVSMDLPVLARISETNKLVADLEVDLKGGITYFKNGDKVYLKLYLAGNVTDNLINGRVIKVHVPENGEPTYDVEFTIHQVLDGIEVVDNLRQYNLKGRWLEFSKI